MSARPELVEEARRWIDKAEHDMVAAEYLVQAGEGLTDVVCFHCQQCAEKYLKGLLVLRGVPFPRTHDLRVLHDLATKSAKLRLSLEKLAPLNRYVIEGRYPGDWEPILQKEAKEALAMARKVREVVRKLLPMAVLKQTK
jgi:HEPN domain-containing protein